MNTLYGLKVVASQLITEVPRIQLSHNFVACSPEVKASMNAWLLEQFGTYLPVYVIQGNTIAMHPKTIALLKLNTEKKARER